MANPNPEAIDLTRWVISIAVPAIAGFVGVFLGSWLASRQQRTQRRLAFIEKQLNEFYSPLLGIRTEIRMLSELRYKISQSADHHWQKMSKEAREIGGAEYLKEAADERREKFLKSIEYNNRQLRESLLPSYRRMLSVFRDHYYLAEDTTREYFRSFLEFVDIWDRWLDKSIPYEVAEDLDNGEASLKPFYEDLERTHNALRTKLTKGEP